MEAKGDITRTLDSLVERMVHRISRALAEEIANSGLIRRLEDIARSFEPAPGKDKKPVGRRGRPRKRPAVCSEKDCQEPARARGLCSRHYQRDRYRRKSARKN